MSDTDRELLMSIRRNALAELTATREQEARIVGTLRMVETRLGVPLTEPRRAQIHRFTLPDERDA